jgi:hypothetical protein
MLFKMTADNRACHSAPFAANRLAPKNNHPSHDEPDVDVDNEASHLIKSLSNRRVR